MNKVTKLLLFFQTLSVLGEVCGMLQVLQDMTSADVHAICEEAQAAVRSIRAESDYRPSSVESLHLTDHSVFSPTPRTDSNWGWLQHQGLTISKSEENQQQIRIGMKEESDELYFSRLKHGAEQGLYLSKSGKLQIKPCLYFPCWKKWWTFCPSFLLYWARVGLAIQGQRPLLWSWILLKRQYFAQNPC